MSFDFFSVPTNEYGDKYDRGIFLSGGFRFCSGIDGFFPVFRNLWEGTGTRPDYLVNRVLAKTEGPLGKKLQRNREIAVE